MDKKAKNKTLLIRLSIALMPALLIVAWLAYNGVLSNSTFPRGLSIYPPSPGLGNVIYIQPVGYVDPDMLYSIRDMLKTDFKHPVKILKTIQIPHFPEGRIGQIKADFIRNHITDDLGIPGDTFRLMAIIDDDLYTDGYNFIFGQAAMGGLVGLVSLKRLMPAASDGGNLIDDKQQDLFLERTRKLIRHELGHTFGLPHCSNTECVMAFHDSLTTLDAGGEFFCDNCQSKLSDVNINLN